MKAVCPYKAFVFVAKVQNSETEHDVGIDPAKRRGVMD